MGERLVVVCGEGVLCCAVTEERGGENARVKSWDRAFHHLECARHHRTP